MPTACTCTVTGSRPKCVILGGQFFGSSMPSYDVSSGAKPVSVRMNAMTLTHPGGVVQLHEHCCGPQSVHLGKVDRLRFRLIMDGLHVRGNATVLDRGVEGLVRQSGCP
jgi:hypothetical protein